MDEVFIVSGARTAIGDYGKALKDVTPVQLATVVIKEALRRASIDGAQVGSVVMGHIINTEANDVFLSRMSAMNAGVGQECPAFNVNRLCGSGLQAIISGAQSIMVEDAAVVVAGGAESMSRAPYLSQPLRWGQRMGDSTMQDMLLGVLTDPFHRIHMGMTAENVATRYQISRSEQDALALESHRRAANAIDAGYFTEQIVPVVINGRKGDIHFDIDEHVRRDISLESLACLQPAFLKEWGTVTAGNASGLNDGAAAVVLMNAASVKKHAVQPLARLVTYAHTGVDPAIMGIGPVSATNIALKRAGLSIEEMDVIEANEAFAAQACAVARELKLDPTKVNPNGSGIGLGHPVGATGAIVTIKALYELKRIKGRFALVTMCIGGGQGIAAIFERV